MKIRCEEIAGTGLGGVPYRLQRFMPARFKYFVKIGADTDIGILRQMGKRYVPCPIKPPGVYPLDVHLRAPAAQFIHRVVLRAGIG